MASPNQKFTVSGSTLWSGAATSLDTLRGPAAAGELTHHPNRLPPIPGLDHPLGAQLRTNIGPLQHLLEGKAAQELKDATITPKQVLNHMLEVRTAGSVLHMRFFPDASSCKLPAIYKRNAILSLLSLDSSGSDTRALVEFTADYLRSAAPSDPSLAGVALHPRLAERMTKLLSPLSEKEKQRPPAPEDEALIHHLFTAATFRIPEEKAQSLALSWHGEFKKQLGAAWAEPLNPKIDELAAAWGTIVDLAALRNFFGLYERPDFHFRAVTSAFELYVTPINALYDYRFLAALDNDRRSEAVRIVEQERDFITRLENHGFLLQFSDDLEPLYKRDPAAPCPLTESERGRLLVRSIQAFRSLANQIERHTQALDGGQALFIPQNVTIDFTLRTIWETFQLMTDSKSEDAEHLPTALLALPSTLGHLETARHPALHGVKGYVEAFVRAGNRLDLAGEVAARQIGAMTAPKSSAEQQARMQLSRLIARPLFPALANFILAPDNGLQESERSMHLKELCAYSETCGVRTTSIHQAHGKLLSHRIAEADRHGDLGDALKAFGEMHASGLIHDPAIQSIVMPIADEVRQILSDYIEVQFSTEIQTLPDHNKLLECLSEQRQVAEYLRLWAEVTGESEAMAPFRTIIAQREREVLDIYKATFAHIGARALEDHFPDNSAADRSKLSHPIGVIRLLQSLIPHDEANTRSHEMLEYLRMKINGR